MAAAPICPAETHPDWAKASAIRKRELLRECHPLPPEPEEQPEVVTVRPTPPPEAGVGSVLPPSKRTRRTMQLLVGSAVTTVAVAGVFSGVFSPLRELGMGVGIASALAIAPLVMLMGGWDVARPPWGATFLGALPGIVVTVGATLLGVALGWTGDYLGAGSYIGAGIGLLLTLPLPALGAVIGYELGLKSTEPPQLALVPVNGGVMAALSARF
jgi:hypothetical protein